MHSKRYRLIAFALFLSAMLITMLLSRAEEQRKQTAKESTPTTYAQMQSEE